MEVPQPEPGEGQVRVKVVAAGISPADYKWRTGMFREMVPLTMPHTLGYNIAGTVDAVGPGVEDFVVGDRVFAMLDPVTKGGYAEYALVDAATLARMPDNLDPQVAATLPTPGLTGVQFIDEQVRPEPGETVLLTGAVGSVGRFALHAIRERGAHVVAAVRASQRDLALALGASEAIVLGEPAPVDMQFNHVADAVGGDDVAALCQLLRPGGRIITIATTPINPEGLAATPAFFAVSPDRSGLERIGLLVADGSVQVPSPLAFPLDQAAEAHRLLEAGSLAGRLVLQM